MRLFKHARVSSPLPALLVAIPPVRRAAVLQAAVSFRPEETLDEEFSIGPVRAAFAEHWEAACGYPVPVCELRDVLEPPVPIATVLEFLQLKIAGDEEDARVYLGELISHLQERIRELRASPQLPLFADSLPEDSTERPNPAPGGTATSLGELVAQGRKFPTIYADPPWQYENRASRAAAENHYPTMSLVEICAEPVRELAADNAHLHLWTTNGFLPEAFEVIKAWGFTYKSCLVWVKDEMGMGNYWRVSHEFLLLGVRGSLTFRSRKESSWIQAQRTCHSRKPGVVRALIEKVSPGPYLELYGREELPDSAWTVYGNRVEPRLF